MNLISNNELLEETHSLQQENEDVNLRKGLVHTEIQNKESLFKIQNKHYLDTIT